MTTPELPGAVRDPDGRVVRFTDWGWDHIMLERPQLLGDVDAILAAVSRPDFRENDPIPGRERFYQRRVSDKVRWMRVVVGFNQEPGYIVTAFIQRRDPMRER